MLKELTGIINEQLGQAARLHVELSKDEPLVENLARWGHECSKALEAGGTVFFAGNGGSFADAQHMAAELTGKMSRPRRSLKGAVLGANSSSLSAIGNDFGFEHTFAREFEGLYSPGSVVVAFSTSGNSPNLVNLARTAASLGAPMVCFTGGDESDIASVCDTIRVPSARTERIQEMHSLLGHTLCLLIEEELAVCEGPYE